MFLEFAISILWWRWTWECIRELTMKITQGLTLHLQQLFTVKSLINLRICYPHRIKIANAKILKICSKTTMRVLNLKLESEMLYDASWRNFEKLRSGAAKLKRCIAGRNGSPLRTLKGNMLWETQPDNKFKSQCNNEQFHYDPFRMTWWRKHNLIGLIC